MGCPLCWWWLQSDFGFIRLCLSVLPHHSSLFVPFICLGTVVVGCSNIRPYYCSCLTFYLETMSCPQSPPTCSQPLTVSWSHGISGTLSMPTHAIFFGIGIGLLAFLLVIFYDSVIFISIFNCIN